MFLLGTFTRVQAGHSLNLERTELSVTLPKPISDHTASLGGDNLIYIAGGCDDPLGNIFDANSSLFFCNSISSSLHAFDPASNEFITTLPDLPRARYRHAGVAINNQLWLVGGRNLTDALLTEVDVYDMETKEWSSFTLPEGYAASDLASWGTETHAYFAGGYDADYTALTKVFSIDVDSFGETAEPEIRNHANLQTARGDVAATVNLDKGYAYVSGGFSHENDFCEPIASVERYSLPGDAWIEVAQLPTARADKVLVSYRGHTLAMGGERQVENKCDIDNPSPGELAVAVNDIEVLNDDDSTWDILTSLPEHRFRFAAVVYNDTIYTFGGQDAYNEDCNCLKTNNEVATFVDTNPPEPEPEHDDQDHDHDDETEDGGASQGQPLEGTEEAVATTDSDSGAVPQNSLFVSFLVLVASFVWGL